MSSNIGMKALAGAMALAIGGTALANTTATTGGTQAAAGTLFLNIVDTTQGTSFFFDTGLTTATFNGSSSYSFGLSSDANYASFLASQKSGDTIDYSVIGAYINAASSAATIQFTTNNTPAAQPGASLPQVTSLVQAFENSVNGTTSTTNNSAFVIGGGANNAYYAGNTEPGVNSNLGSINDAAALGTALAFYTTSSTHLRSTTTLSSLSEYAGTWDLTSGGTLTYGGGAAVPLPAPLVLLLSGLGLMGVVSRRNKATA